MASASTSDSRKRKETDDGDMAQQPCGKCAKCVADKEAAKVRDIETTIYGCSMVPSCRLLLWFCQSTEIAIKYTELSLVKRQHLEPWFVAINPLHTVPCLSEEGFTLTESPAIMRYLSEKFQKYTLYPKDLRRRALVDQILDWLPANIQRHVQTIFCSTFITSSGPQRQEVMTKLGRSLLFLDGKLAGNPYLVGESMTMADMAVAIELAHLGLLGIAEFDREMALRPNLSRWMEKMQACDIFARLHASVRRNREKLSALGERGPICAKGTCALGTTPCE